MPAPDPQTASCHLFGPALAWLDPCAWATGGFLSAAGPVAAAQRGHFLAIIGWMLIVVLPVFVAVPFVLWRYRRKGRGRYDPDWSFNRPLEILIWAAPAAIVVLLGVQIWGWTHQFDPYRPLAADRPPLEVDVVALDWKFLFIYPSLGVASVNEVTIPAGRPVDFHLTSGSVMQSFIIPRLGGQIYAMAGMETRINLQADAPGDYRGRNTQYNGAHFADDRFIVHAVAPGDFKAWAEKARARPGRLDMKAYDALAAPSVVATPIHYGAVETGLFDKVIATYTGEPPATAPVREAQR